VLAPVSEENIPAERAVEDNASDLHFGAAVWTGDELDGSRVGVFFMTLSHE